MLKFNSLVEMLRAFPDEQSCADHLKAVRWREGEYCPHCGCTKVYHFKDGKTYKCADCRKRFSITVGTVFESSKISLHQWFIAIYLVTAHKKGISSHQLARDLGVTQKTAWFMLGRLRYAAETKAFNEPLKNIVEADETYIGGKEKNKHQSKRNPYPQGRQTDSKHPVLALVERNGNVRAFPVTDCKGKTLRPLIMANVALGARVVTDEFKSYLGLRPWYKHETVNHKEGEYVKGVDTHTNTVEGFFSNLKRGIVGIYHHVSVKHLHRYLSEFTFRYNDRKQPNGTGFARMLDNCRGRLTYQGLIADA